MPSSIVNVSSYVLRSYYLAFRPWFWHKMHGSTQNPIPIPHSTTMTYSRHLGPATSRIRLSCSCVISRDHHVSTRSASGLPAGIETDGTTSAQCLRPTHRFIPGSAGLWSWSVCMSPQPGGSHRPRRQSEQPELQPRATNGQLAHNVEFEL